MFLYQPVQLVPQNKKIKTLVSLALVHINFYLAKADCFILHLSLLKIKGKLCKTFSKHILNAGI